LSKRRQRSWGADYVFVEKIINPVLVGALEKRGYTVVRKENPAFEMRGITFPALDDTVEAYKAIRKQAV